MSCNKDNTSKDYMASIKGKTWWGMFTYTGNTSEYYSVHFNEDNSLDWSQLPGDDGGQWLLDGKHLTISLTRNNVKMQADISNDDKLENVTDNSSKYEFKSGQLIPNPKLSLANTVWKGDWGGVPFLLTFLNDSRMKTKFGSDEREVTYTRSSSGAAIRFDRSSVYYYMAVITTDTVMKVGDNGMGLWRAVKQ
jgi:hypothetical protein